jgi:hypothetical protein
MAYLTSRQLSIWRLRRDGLRQFIIAKRLRVTRQAIHNAIGVIDSKVSKALTDAARANKAKVQHVDPVKGILLGYSPEVKDQIIITFSVKNGIQTWYRHTGQCADCDLEEECRKMLLEEAEERSVTLSEEDKGEPPAKLAHKVFSKVIRGLEP